MTFLCLVSTDLDGFGGEVVVFSVEGLFVVLLLVL
jgi:hypothetical protein